MNKEVYYPPIEIVKLLRKKYSYLTEDQQYTAIIRDLVEQISLQDTLDPDKPVDQED